MHEEHHPEINRTYRIPQNFYEIIEPYIVQSEKKRTITNVSELISLWQAALSARESAPELSQTITEWTMSAVASSPLLTDPMYENIHHRFGQAEVPSEQEEDLWSHLCSLIMEAADREK